YDLRVGAAGSARRPDLAAGAITSLPRRSRVARRRVRYEPASDSDPPINQYTASPAAIATKKKRSCATPLLPRGTLFERLLRLPVPHNTAVQRRRAELFALALYP